MEPLEGFALLALLILILGFWLFDRRAKLIRKQLQIAQQERDQIREELRQVRLERDWITSSVGDGILLIDASEQILFMNDVAKKILDLRPQDHYSLKDMAWWLDVQPLIREVLTHRAGSLGQTVVKDERAFQVNVRALPTDARPAAILLIHEVTELQRLGRVRRDFVANISHELRTPVTTLQLLVETLSKELPTNQPRVADWLAKLQEQVGVLQQLAEEMMGLALIESGQMPIRLLETPVIDLVQGALEVLRPQAEHKGIAIETQVPPDLCALADAAGIRKVLNNLLHNAIKFTPARGRIVISARPSDDNIEIQIADTGIGIPARDLSRIFERFYKADQSRAAHASRGTGLGLAIAKHIVEGHGGTIRVESIEGQGSTFYFTLPACEK